MSKKLHVIYVPGLGDTKVGLQQAVTNFWRWYDVEPELFQMNWANGEAWQPKFDRLLARIDKALEQGGDVGLVGASAGASAVLNAYAARQDQIIGVVCISGKINRPENIRDSYRRNDPAFITSAYDCQKVLKQLDAAQRERILSRYGLFDEIVTTKDSVIPGANNQRIPTIIHGLNIATQLTLGAPSFIRFLKRRTQHNS